MVTTCSPGTAPSFGREQVSSNVPSGFSSAVGWLRPEVTGMKVSRPPGSGRPSARRTTPRTGEVVGGSGGRDAPQPDRPKAARARPAARILDLNMIPPSKVLIRPAIGRVADQ